MIDHPVRVIVLRGGDLRDVLWTLPVCDAIRAQWPNAWIEFVGYSRFSELLLGDGRVNAYRSIEDKSIAQLFALRLNLSDSIQEYFLSFDMVLNFLRDPDGRVVENLEAAGAKQVVCPRTETERRADIHEVDHLLQSLESLAIFESGAVPKLNLDDKVRALGRTSDRPLALIHPGNLLENFNALGEMLSDYEVRFLIDGAVHEQSLAIPENQCFRPASIVQSASMLQQANLFIGPDSEIAHLASALGVTGLALSQDVDSARYATRGSIRTIAASCSLDEIRAEIATLPE